MFETLVAENTMLFIFIVIGFVSVKLNLLYPHHIEGLSKVLLNIALPCAILNSLQIPFSKEVLRDIGITFCASVVILMFTFFAGAIFSKILHIEGIERKIWIACCVFSSILFIGIPIIGALYGNRGLIILVTYNTVANICLFSFGVKMFSNDQAVSIRLPELIKNPAIIAAIIGFLMFFLNLQLPEPLFKANASLGGLTVPISMLITGAMVATSNLGNLFRDKRVYYFCLVRLIIIPVILLTIMKPVFSSSMMLGIFLIVGSMPSGASNSVFAELYSGKGAVASRYIIMSTILSIVTIPVLFLFV